MLTNYFKTIPLALILALGIIGSLHAKIEVREFTDAAQERRYHKMVDELRCLVCQNQNLADSNSQLAQDLRDRVYTMIKTQKTDQQVIDYMVERYGKFVLYNPPLDPITSILWIGPFLLLLVGVVFLLLNIKKQSKTKPTSLSEADHERSRQLLEGDNKP